MPYFEGNKREAEYLGNRKSRFFSRTSIDNMLKQIFKENVPINMLYELLEKICLKTDKYYFIDANAFKKMQFHNLQNAFIEAILPYYHSSKQFYVTRKMTYNSFTNVIRQICKSNAIMFNSQLKYNESKYTIDYFIYY